MLAFRRQASIRSQPELEFFQVTNHQTGGGAAVPSDPRMRAACLSILTVKVGFDYLNNRLTGNCQDNYDCSSAYEICRVSRIFDPSFGSVSASAQMIDELCAAVPSLQGHATALKQELQQYRQAARNAGPIDHGDHKTFTAAVLKFWKLNAQTLKAWSTAAKIVFAIPPTSAASERVFALLKNMFGDNQILSLGDYIEAALMLAYNERKVG